MQLKSSSIYISSRASLHGCISRCNTLHPQQAIGRRYRLEASAPPKRRVLKRILPKRLFESMVLHGENLCPFLGVHIALPSLERYVNSSRQFCLAWQSVCKKRKPQKFTVWCLFVAKPKHLSISLQLQTDPFVTFKVLMRSSDVILVVWYSTASYEEDR